jgi:F-type H+-transporting ATPase subunit b
LFDKTEWFPNFFWALTVFLPVLAVILFVVRPKIAEALRDREKGIEERIVEVEAQSEEAVKRLAECKSRLSAARTDADKIHEEGRSDAEVLKRRYLKDQSKEAEALKKRMAREIQLARDKALDDLHQETVRLTLDRAAGLIEKNLTATDHKKLIEKTMAEAEAAASGKTT